MVILKNIKRTAMGIECEYDPEKSGMCGHIYMKNDGSADIEYSDYKYGKKTYAQKAMNKLNELLKITGDIPRESAVTWY